MELRAAIEMSRLCHGTGRTRQATRLLKDISGQIEGGFDGIDYREATARPKCP